NHVSMLIAPGGRIVVANTFSGVLLSDDLCSWHTSKSFSHMAPDGGMVSELVPDITQHGADLYAVTSTGVKGLINGHVWKSSDNGDTWTAVEGQLPSDFAGWSIALPPS